VTAAPGRPARRGDRESLRNLVAIVAAAAAVTAAVGVRGDFPLSDDWSYAYSSQVLCTDGSLRFLPWTGASLVFQTWYGAVLCRLAGFSFEILRASTLVLATLGAVGFDRLLATAGVTGAVRVLALACFALCPLYVNLAFTFMTDVPFTVAAVWAGYAYVHGFACDRRRPLVLGGIASAVALLIRQHGVFVAAAAALTALSHRDRPWRDRLADAAAAAAFPAIVAIGYHVWLLQWHGAPEAVATKLSEAATPTVTGVVNAAFRGVATLAFLLAPVALAVRRDVAARRPRLALALSVLLGILAGALWLRLDAAMFYLTNVMYDLGLGASSLRDTQFLGLRPPVALGTPLRAVLTPIAVLAAAVLAAACFGGPRLRRDQVARFLTIAAAVLFLGSLLHTRYYFDRYLLVIVPFALAATCVSATARVGRSSVVASLLLAFYAIAGTHDYLAWNRARYAGLAELTEAGVSPREIDGGMEFNAWKLAATLGTWPTNAEARVGQPPTRKSWWWVVDDRYVASFRPLPDYTVRRALPYQRWLPPGEGHVFILERAAQ
jgi:hypothetical protein